jgi:hypothetical protein
MAPISAPNITAASTTSSATIPVPTVWARWRPKNKKAMKLKNPAHITAYCGRNTRVAFCQSIGLRDALGYTRGNPITHMYPRTRRRRASQQIAWHPAVISAPTRRCEVDGPGLAVRAGSASRPTDQRSSYRLVRCIHQPGEQARSLKFIKTCLHFRNGLVRPVFALYVITGGPYRQRAADAKNRSAQAKDRSMPNATSSRKPSPGSELAPWERVLSE